MAIADTSFVIDVLRGDPGASHKIADLIARNEPLWLPSVVLHELEYGASLHTHADRERARIRGVEAALPVIPFEAAHARAAGAMEADLERRGLRPGRVDVQVAAVALARGESVLTRDSRFPQVPGVRTERY